MHRHGVSRFFPRAISDGVLKVIVAVEVFIGRVREVAVTVDDD